MLGSGDNPVGDLVRHTAFRDIADRISQYVGRSERPSRCLYLTSEVRDVLEEEHCRSERAHKQHVLVKQLVTDITRLGIIMCMDLILSKATDLTTADPTKTLAWRSSENHGHLTGILVQYPKRILHLIPCKQVESKRIALLPPIEPQIPDPLHWWCLEEIHKRPNTAS